MKNIKPWINSLGVAFAAIGSYLVWRYLTQIDFTDREEFLKGNGSVTVFDPTPAQINAFRRALFLSKVGLWLILFGGVCQIASNHLPD